MAEFVEDPLIPIEQSRKKPKTGDIFVVQPRSGIYLYARVMRTKIPSKNSAINGWNLIYVYEGLVDEIKIPDPVTMSPEKLLIPPMITNNQGWLQGYFKTIGTSEVADGDFAKNTGFKKYPQNTYVDEEGNSLDFVPEVSEIYALGNSSAVGERIEMVLRKRGV